MSDDTMQEGNGVEFVNVVADRQRMVDEAFLESQVRSARNDEDARRHTRFVEEHFQRQTDALESIATALVVISSHYIEGCDEHDE